MSHSDWGTGDPWPTDGGWPGSDQPASTLTVTGPPVAPLIVAGVCVLAGAVLLLVVRHSAAAVLLAWLLAGPVAIVSVGIFLQQDTGRRAGQLYHDTGWAGPTSKVLLVVGIVLASIASWFFADWVARL